jgi:hypothetical protein
VCHAASVLKEFVCGIDNRIDLFCGDIALHDLNGLTGWKEMFHKD